VKYELWHNAQHGVYWYLAVDRFIHQERDRLPAGTEKVWVYEARSRFDAMRAYNEHMGWAPWEPEKGETDVYYPDADPSLPFYKRWWARLLKRKVPASPPTPPFMEHSEGEYASTLEAIRSAMQRLDQMDMAGRWITFSGQGQGSRPQSYQIEEVPFSGRTFDLKSQNVDVQSVLGSAGLADAGLSVEASPDGKVTLPNASPDQLARFLDALFREHFGIKPCEGEGEYAVSAEW